MAQPDFDPSDAVGFWDMTNRQDWRVCELTQLGVASQAYTPGPYAQEEDLLFAFDQGVPAGDRGVSYPLHLPATARGGTSPGCGRG